MTAWRLFEDRDKLAAGVAAALAETVRARLAETERAALALAGGSTPGPAYDRLACLDLPWARVTVTLTDERWVEPTSALANAGLLRRRLLTGPAAAARLESLKGFAATLEAAAREAEARLAPLLPFAAVLLGMGEDGHIASLFPRAPELSQGLDPDGERLCLPVPLARLEPFVPRLTLTLAALTATRALLLLITGDAKRALVEQALSGDSHALPVAAVLRQTRVPVTILWSP